VSWGQLKNMLDAQRETEREDKRDPPVACPHCGSILDVKDGIRYCPFGDYRWP